jgi:hypothetical protein
MGVRATMGRSLSNGLTFDEKPMDFKAAAPDLVCLPAEQAVCALHPETRDELLASLSACPPPGSLLQAGLQMPPPESEIIHGIKTIVYTRKETDPLGDIVDMLAGHVFHATRRSSYDRILACGEIRSNPEGTLPPGYGNPNGFFRKRNCVSLFDYRSEPPPDRLEFRTRCSPFQLAQPCGELAILIFKREIEPLLIPWTRRDDERAFRDMVVPYVEAGHQGPISVDMISEVLLLTCVEDPGSLAALVRSACPDRAGRM